MFGEHRNLLRAGLRVIIFGEQSSFAFQTAHFEFRREAPIALITLLGDQD